jgi:hypothetical protein
MTDLYKLSEPVGKYSPYPQVKLKAQNQNKQMRFQRINISIQV